MVIYRKQYLIAKHPFTLQSHSVSVSHHYSMLPEYACCRGLNAIDKECNIYFVARFRIVIHVYVFLTEHCILSLLGFMHYNNNNIYRAVPFLRYG